MHGRRRIASLDRTSYNICCHSCRCRSLQTCESVNVYERTAGSNRCYAARPSSRVLVLRRILQNCSLDADRGNCHCYRGSRRSVLESPESEAIHCIPQNILQSRGSETNRGYAGNPTNNAADNNHHAAAFFFAAASRKIIAKNLSTSG